LCFEGRPLYLAICCCVIGVLAVLEGILGPAIIGILLSIAMVVLAIIGCIGAFLKTKTFLLWFIIGCGAIIVFDVVGAVISGVQSSWGSLAIDIIAVLFYIICILLALSIRENKFFGFGGKSGTQTPTVAI